MAAYVSRFLMVVVLCALAVSASAQSEQGHADQPSGSDWVANKTKACQACHGKQGVSQQPTFPTLAGQYQSYLLHSLKAYRDGARSGGNANIMAGQVKGLTDAQLKALARYYSEQDAGPLHTPYVD